MKFAAAITIVLVSALMVRKGYRRGAADMLMGLGPLAAAITVVACLWRFDCLSFWGLTGGVVVAIVAALTASVLVRRALEPRRRKLSARTGRFDRGAGSVLGLLLASYICLLAAEIGSVIVFGMTVTAPAQRPADPAGGTLAIRDGWVESLGDFCSATADFTVTGVLRHLPYAGQYADDMRAMVKILNAPKEDLDWVARKHGLFELAETPEIRRALTDRGYLQLLLRARRGDLGALYKMATNEITRDVFNCREIREFAGNLKLSEILDDIERSRAHRARKARTKSAKPSPPSPADVADTPRPAEPASDTAPAPDQCADR